MTRIGLSLSHVATLRNYIKERCLVPAVSVALNAMIAVYPNGTGEKEQPGTAHFVSGTNINISSVGCALPIQGVLV
jgi:hypothetical protein